MDGGIDGDPRSAWSDALEARVADVKVPTLPLLASGLGSRPVAEQWIGIVPDTWHRHVRTAGEGVVDFVRRSITETVDSWLAVRPGDATLRETSLVLEDQEQSVIDALNVLGTRAPGGQLTPGYLHIRLDPLDEQTRAVVGAVASTQWSPAPLLFGFESAVAPGFFRWQHRLVDDLEIYEAPATHLEHLRDAVQDLSPSTRRYLLAICDEPATHDALRRRLGDRQAFGGGESKLAPDLEAVTTAGLVDIDEDGVLSPINASLATYLLQ